MLIEVNDPTLLAQYTSGTRRVKGIAQADGDTAVLAVALVNAATGLPYVSGGASKKAVLTPSSPTAVTSLSTTAGTLASVQNASASAQTVTLTLYDEGASPAGAVADQIAVLVNLAAGAVVQLGIPLSNGLAYKLSAAAGANILVLYT